MTSFVIHYDIGNYLAVDEGMPEFVSKLSIYALTCALRDLNAALDHGKAMTFAEVYAHLELEDLVEYLQEHLGVHLSLVRPGIPKQILHPGSQVRAR